jgi:preprotein translocase subunit SecF
LALFVFGGEVLEGFAFTMLVGIISGTYSTVFIASALAILLQGRKPLKGQMSTGGSAAPATAAAVSSGATRPSKRNRAS